MLNQEFHRACRVGNVLRIQSTLSNRPTLLNQTDNQLGWAPLYRTVICGHLHASRFLLELGADPNVVNWLGETPLHQAADNNQLELAQLLLQHKANPNARQKDGESPLDFALAKGHRQMVQLLVRSGAKPRQASLDCTGDVSECSHTMALPAVSKNESCAEEVWPEETEFLPPIDCRADRKSQ